MKTTFNNPEIVTIALYLLGGTADYIDIEHIAMKANELSPGRFAWRHYADQINLFQIANSLSDARKEKNGSYVLGTIQGGWMLTDSGQHFAQTHIGLLENVNLSRKPQTAKERQWEKAERARMISETAYTKFTSSRLDEITTSEVEAFFRVNDYVIGQARERKIVRILNVFGQDAELGRAVQALVGLVRGK